MEHRIVTSGCGCASCPTLKISTPCGRQSKDAVYGVAHVAGWPEYKWVTREELELRVKEG